jgi:hypothetical protein
LPEVLRKLLWRIALSSLASRPLFAFKNIPKPISEKGILRDWLMAKIPASLQDSRFFEVLNAEGTWEWSLQL